MGNGKYENASGSSNGEDSRCTAPAIPTTRLTLQNTCSSCSPPLLGITWCDADHSSWLNSLTNPNAPILDIPAIARVLPASLRGRMRSSPRLWTAPTPSGALRIISTAARSAITPRPSLKSPTMAIGRCSPVTGAARWGPMPHLDAPRA